MSPSPITDCFGYEYVILFWPTMKEDKSIDRDLRKVFYIYLKKHRHNEHTNFLSSCLNLIPQITAALYPWGDLARGKKIIFQNGRAERQKNLDPWRHHWIIYLANSGPLMWKQFSFWFKDIWVGLPILAARESII